MPRPARSAAQDVNPPSMNQVAIDPDGELTLAEWAIFEQLPRPPAFADITTTNVWIVEWLSEDEQATGRDLHHWMELRRRGWSKYIRCRSKAQVFAAIDSAAVLAQSSGMVPILHLEAHGADWGIASNGETAGEVIEWHELTQPLQSLNVATKCKLLVFVAACEGFAGIQALAAGPRAPALALVGPDRPLTPSALLEGSKEFYRQRLGVDANLHDLAASASREVGPATFEVEPFAEMWYEVMVTNLIKSTRPDVRRQQLEKLRLPLRQFAQLTNHETNRRWTKAPASPTGDQLQEIWDTMFMFDLDPSNRSRFALDVRALVEMVRSPPGTP
jgi:hypothetical protein